MSENIQTNYDINFMFNLAREIIFARKFESLVELDAQCKMVYEDIENNIPLNIDNSRYLDCLYIYLYYIYYVMLKEDEELIFMHLRELIMYKNNELVDFYRNPIDIQEMMDFFYNNGDIESYYLYTIGMHILYKYNSFCGLKEMNLDKSVSEILNILYKNNFTAIPNELYLICLLGFKVINYKEKLEPSAYNNLHSRLYEILTIISQKYDNGLILMDADQEEEVDNDILEQSGALTW